MITEHVHWQAVKFVRLRTMNEEICIILNNIGICETRVHDLTHDYTAVACEQSKWWPSTSIGGSQALAVQ